MLEHAHNDSKRHRHGPVSRASKPTNRGERGDQGINLGNVVEVTHSCTLVRLQGPGAQAGVESLGYHYLFLSSAFAFILFIYLKRTLSK